MSIYRELNELRLDVSQFEEPALTEEEQKRWEHRVLRKLRKPERAKSGKWVGMASAFLLAMGLIVPLNPATIANVPFVAGLIERFLDQNELLDYSAYKTQIGQTAQNAYGKLTLNEVLVDNDNLLISSTYEPAAGVSFDYRTYLIPRVLVNGEDLVRTRRGQSIEVNDRMYTIYGDIELRDLPDDEHLRVTLAYDTFDLRKPIEEPWVFDISVPTSRLAQDTTTIELNKTVRLQNGQKVTVSKVVSTPVSTMVYYDVTEASEAVHFKIVSADGEELTYREAYVSDEAGEISYGRYAPIDLRKEKYRLVPYDGFDRPGEELSEGIPLP